MDIDQVENNKKGEWKKGEEQEATRSKSKKRTRVARAISTDIYRFIARRRGRK